VGIPRRRATFLPQALRLHPHHPSVFIAVWAEGIRAELKQRLPRQRKRQRDKLAVLVATMLHVRSANLVELVAGLPRASDRRDMGYQWISRFLANDRVCCDTVMEPFAHEIPVSSTGQALARLAESGEPRSLILDQTRTSDRHQCQSARNRGSSAFSVQAERHRSVSGCGAGDHAG
jgi:hypothetical protein